MKSRPAWPRSSNAFRNQGKTAADGAHGRISSHPSCVGQIGSIDSVPGAAFPGHGLLGGRRPLCAKSLAEIPYGGSVSAPSSFLTRQRGRLPQHVAVQHHVLVFLGIVHMLMTVSNCIFLFMLALLVPVGFGLSQQLVCGNTSSARGGEGRQGRKGREGRMSVAEEAGCEEDACLCRLQPGVELGCVSTHERRGSTTGSEKKTKMVLQVPKLGSASISNWTTSMYCLPFGLGQSQH